MRQLKRPMYAGDTRPQAFTGAEAMRDPDGTLTVTVSTNLYQKKNNEPAGVGICGTVLGFTFAGRKATLVTVKASDKTTLASTRDNLCRGRSDL